MNDRLKDKVAIITGGSSGIGKGIALRFSMEGAKVIIASRSKKLLDATIDELKNDSKDSLAILCDVTNSEDVKNLINKTIEKYGKIDVLVNNAGKNPDRLATVEDLTEKEWDEYFNINAKGSWLCSKYTLAEMKKNKSSSIIMISSVSAHLGQPLMGCYNASKAAQDTLAKSMAIDFAKYNIRVNSICPAWVATEANNLIAKRRGHVFEKPIGTGVKTYDEILDMHPIGRIGTVDDIAWMALFLASDESRWITGASYMVDGGYTCR